MTKPRTVQAVTRRQALQTLASGAALAAGGAGASALAAEHGKDGALWGYGGKIGPEHWGTLSSDFAACATGRHQSPIDLSRMITADLPVPRIDYKPVPLNIVNNGHTVQVNYARGSRMTLDGETFELLQFHFHHPSEHALDGRRADMECHLVHKHRDGRLAVLGVFISRASHNDKLDVVWDHMPMFAGDHRENEKVEVDARHFLPEGRKTLQYYGSLTTPPCTEGVRWIIFQEPIPASSAQIEKFKSIFPMNARSLQDVHRRFLLKGR